MEIYIYSIWLFVWGLKDPTNKLWCSKDVLELIPGLDLVSDPKVDQFNPGVGDIFVQQHDILRLKNKKEYSNSMDRNTRF